MSVESPPTESKPQNLTRCPDCDTEYPKTAPGIYRCSVCYCKFEIDENTSINIIPYFDEVKLEPLLVMLSVLGIVIVVALGDGFLSLSDRIKLFLVFVVGVVGLYKLTKFLCRRYRGVDRFLRKISRFGYEEKTESGLINVSKTKK